MQTNATDPENDCGATEAPVLPDIVEGCYRLSYASERVADPAHRDRLNAEIEDVRDVFETIAAVRGYDDHERRQLWRRDYRPAVPYADGGHVPEQARWADRIATFEKLGSRLGPAGEVRLTECLDELRGIVTHALEDTA